MFDWLREHEDLLYWLGIVSVLSLVASLIAIPVLIARLPEDYFSHRRRQPVAEDGRSPVRLLGAVFKNLFGGLLVLAGLLMLFLPGQGVLTIVIGLTIMNFPGKYRLERGLVGRGAVLKALNWIRTRAGKPPLRVSSEAGGE
jgi:Putative transmembrane protein (PGPGW)